MIQRGINLGKGLQLTNILRDLPEDIGLGRLYLPMEKLAKDNIGQTEILTYLNRDGVWLEQWRPRRAQEV